MIPRPLRVRRSVVSAVGGRGAVTATGIRLTGDRAEARNYGSPGGKWAVIYKGFIRFTRTWLILSMTTNHHL